MHFQLGGGSSRGLLRDYTTLLLDRLQLYLGLAAAAERMVDRGHSLLPSLAEAVVNSCGCSDFQLGVNFWTWDDVRAYFAIGCCHADTDHIWPLNIHKGLGIIS